MYFAFIQIKILLMGIYTSVLILSIFSFQMFAALDNKRDSVLIRQNFLESLLRECQQTNQPLLNQLIEYYFQTESPNALLLIKQFSEVGKEQFKVSHFYDCEYRLEFFKTFAFLGSDGPFKYARFKTM